MSTNTHRPDNWQQHCKQAYLFIVGSLQKPLKKKEDLLRVLHHTGRNPTPRSVNTIWTKNTKSITYEEFLDLCYTIPVTTENDLLKAFGIMDKDKNGLISTDEFLQSMSTGENAIQRKDLLNLLRKSDTDRDGKLNYKKFVAMMMSSFDQLMKKIPEDEYQSAARSTSNKSSPQRTPREDTIGTIGPFHKSNQDKTFDAVDSQTSCPSSSTPSKNALATPETVLENLTKIAEYKFTKVVEFTKPDQTLLLPNDWTTVKRRGCLLSHPSIEPQELLVSHVLLELNAPVQLQLNIYVDSELTKQIDSANLTFIVIGENETNLAWSNTDGSSTLHIELEPGNYKVVPIYNGTLSNQRSSHRKKTKLVKNEADKGFVLINRAREAIGLLFKLYDADMNQLWSRDEFRRFARQTYQREHVDEVWDAIREFCTLENEQLPLEELVELFTREVQEDNGSPDSLWTAFERSGLNENFQFTGALPFLFNLSLAENQQKDVEIKMMDLNTYNYLQLEQKITDWVLTQGELLSVVDTSKGSQNVKKPIKLAFMHSANCVLLAFESTEKLTKNSTLFFKLTTESLDIQPTSQHLVKPDLLVTRLSTQPLFSAQFGNCVKNLLFIGTILTANLSVKTEITAGFES